MSIPPLYVVESISEAVRLDVSVNGVSVIRVLAPGRRTTQVKLNPWLVSGHNVITARLLPPAASAGRAGEPAFALRLIHGEHGRLPGPEGVLADLEWDPADRPLEPGRPIVFEAAFWADDVPTGWAWESAPTGSLSEGERRQILRVVEAVHEGLVGRDAEAVVALHRRKHAELGIALGVPPDELADDHAGLLSSAMTADDWRVAPLDLDTLSLEEYADGRLIEVRGPGSLPPLQARSGGRPLAFGLTLTQVDGTWAIVR
ncbi:hypothetical protein [Rubrivirga marina]|uniref:Uncharacterized protein n=1 Tax=Rubrivirga marina TaxID=1196024 RepID=A0A271J0C6_9BACT|nr:hypothetical protein [Rubrivirga marina]PAP76961.1 hypothetical protein BSZ37_11230 [Rubrivirga marina]